MSVKEDYDFRKVYQTLSFMPEKYKLSEWMSQTEYKPQKEDVKWSDDTIWLANVFQIPTVAAAGLCIASFKNPSLRLSQRVLIGVAAPVTMLVGKSMAASKSEEKLLALQTPMGDRYRQVRGSFESSNSKESLVLRRSKTSAGGSFYGDDMEVVTHLPRDSSTSSHSSWKEQDNHLAQEELKATVSKQQPQQQLQQPHHQTRHRHHYQQQQQQQQHHYGSKDKDGLLPVWNPETEEKEGDTLDYAEEEKARRRQERREERRRKREAKELRIKIEEEERARERKSHPSYMHHHPFNERQERRARHQEMARRREREFEEEERNDSKNWS